MNYDFNFLVLPSDTFKKHQSWIYNCREMQKMRKLTWNCNGQTEIQIKNGKTKKLLKKVSKVKEILKIVLKMLINNKLKPVNLTQSKPALINHNQKNKTFSLAASFVLYYFRTENDYTTRLLSCRQKLVVFIDTFLRCLLQALE